MTTYTEKVRIAPLEPSAYGTVEIAWYPDHLEITALGAGHALTEERLSADGEDVVVEIRRETVPGAD